MSRLLIQADLTWLDGSFTPGVTVAVGVGGRIESVGSAHHSGSGAFRRMEGMALLPGFVNTHTHQSARRPVRMDGAYVLYADYADSDSGIIPAGGRSFLEALQKGAKLDTVVVTLGAKGAVARQGERQVFAFGYGIAAVSRQQIGGGVGFPALEIEDALKEDASLRLDSGGENALARDGC